MPSSPSSPSRLERLERSLWRNPDFLRLWFGQTVSIFGSLITRTALPFTAILFLKATPVQVAIVSSLDLFAGFLIGLFAGVWVDRLPRRTLMIATDLARALVVLVVPAAAFLGFLRMEWLYVVAFLSGALTTLFDVAYTSYLPTLVAQDDLLEGNSKVTATASAAEMLAFGTGGWLVQVLSAPFTLLIDAVTFLISAIALLLIRKPERPPTAPILPSGTGWEGNSGSRFGHELLVGIRTIFSHPELRALALSQWILDFGSRIFGTLFLLYTTRTLELAPGVQGTIFALGGITSFLGAVFAERLTARFGFGRAMIGGLLFIGLGSLMVPLAPDGSWLEIGFLIANQLLTDPAWTLYDIGQVTLRQSVVEERVLGRVDATFRAGSLAAMLTGTLLSGFLGEYLGLRNTLFLGAGLCFLAPLLLTFSPLRHRRDALSPPKASHQEILP
ncbi:MAG: MFS transporter [Armatimonadaceae bacterium]